MKTIPPFEESHKFALPLNAESIALDCGAYHGNWSREIAKRFNCHVYAFEPAAAFHKMARESLKEHENVTVYNFAVGAETSEMKLHIKGDSTGAFADSAEVETVHVLNLIEVMDTLGVRFCHALKLNIEGGEFALLEMLTANPHFIRRFDCIIVQFHRIVPDAIERHAKIYGELLRTHTHEFGPDPFHWQRFSLKK